MSMFAGELNSILLSFSFFLPHYYLSSNGEHHVHKDGYTYCYWNEKLSLEK